MLPDLRKLPTSSPGSRCLGLLCGLSALNTGS